MINYVDVKNEITRMSSSGEWGQILDLIGCKDSINPDIDDILKSKLYYYYSNLSIVMLSTNNLEFHYKYFKLFKEAATLAKSLENNKLTYLRTLAYIYKNIYMANPWKQSTFRDVSTELKEEMAKDHYNKYYVRDMALYLYIKALEKDPNDIKTNYRAGHLLMKLEDSGRQSFDGDKPIDYTVGLKDVLSGAVIEQYSKTLSIRKIDKMHMRNFRGTYALYLARARDLWVECKDEKEKLRTKKEYLKALYSLAKFFISNVGDKNKEAMGLKYNIITDCTSIDNFNYQNAYKIIERDKKAAYKCLEIIYKELKYPSNVDDLFDKEFLSKSYAVEPNYYYYLLAKYYIHCEVQRGETSSIEKFVKAFYTAVIINFNYTTLLSRNKSVSPWISFFFSDFLRKVGLHREADIFFGRYCVKMSYKFKKIMLIMGEIAGYSSKNEFEKAKAVAENYLNDEKASERDKLMVRKALRRVELFANDSSIVKKNRIEKEKQIIIKNALASMGFYKKK